MLSGGEKALTAIALVFAIFQLNPAPFCLLDEVDAPLDDANTERYAKLVASMSKGTQFLFISHNKIAMEMARAIDRCDDARARRLAHRGRGHGICPVHGTRLSTETGQSNSMSTLQISLAVVGVILLGLIVAYNTWTHRRNAPKRADAETRLSDNHSRFDPALDGVDVTNLPEHARTPFGGSFAGCHACATGRFRGDGPGPCAGGVACRYGYRC